MLLESIIDLSLAAVAIHLLPVLTELAGWFLAGLSAFDLSDLAVGIVIYLVERMVSGRGQVHARRVPVRRRTGSDRIYPTLSSV